MKNLTVGKNAFIEKTKKQAKRLLKLAQSKESTLKITSLASAQEYLHKSMVTLIGMPWSQR